MRRLLVLLIAVAAVVVVVVVYHGKHTTNNGSTTTTSASTPTTVAPVAPLTGLPDPAGQALTRPALTVKVENTPEALPQWGIDRADVVYEEIVNGGITRLAAIFNSQAPPKVGPVRSVRPTDTQIVWPLGGIFAYSGGAPYAVQSISTAPVKLIDETNAGAAMYRDPRSRHPTTSSRRPARSSTSRARRRRRRRCSATARTPTARPTRRSPTSPWTSPASTP